MGSPGTPERSFLNQTFESGLGFDATHMKRIDQISVKMYDAKRKLKNTYEEDMNDKLDEIKTEEKKASAKSKSRAFAK